MPCHTWPDRPYKVNRRVQHILSCGEITSPAEKLRLAGMYLQPTSPNMKRIWRIITGHIRT